MDSELAVGVAVGQVGGRDGLIDAAVDLVAVRHPDALPLDDEIDGWRAIDPERPREVMANRLVGQGVHPVATGGIGTGRSVHGEGGALIEQQHADAVDPVDRVVEVDVDLHRKVARIGDGRPSLVSVARWLNPVGVTQAPAGVPHRGTEPALGPFGPPPLVGRERELRAIELTLGAASRGIASLVAFTGEAGIGKTRVAEWAAERAVELGFTCVWGSGWPEGGSPPLWPWQAIIEQLDDGAAPQLLDEGGADRERFGRFRAVAGSLRRSTERQPLLIVIDDAHAADVGALLLGRFVIRSLRSARLAMVVTHRDGPAVPDPVAAALVELGREGASLMLPTLLPTHVGELLAWAGQRDDVTLEAELRELTGGNPLLVRELLQGGDVDVAARRHAGHVLSRRLTTIGRDERLVLSALALLGPDGSEAMVAEVAGVDGRQVQTAQQQGVGAGLLRAGDRGAPEFTHALLRDALLDELAPAELAALHEAAAEVLAQGATVSGERLVRIARHRLAVAEARLDEDSVSAAGGASREAAGVLVRDLAYESAAGLLRATVALYERAGMVVPAATRVVLAGAELSGGRLTAAREEFRLALAAAETSGDTPTYAEAAIGLGGIWVLEHRSTAEISQFHGVLRQAVTQLGDERPDLRIRLDARLAAEAAYVGAGSVDDVRAVVNEARRLGDRRVLAEVLSLLHHCILGPEHTLERRGLADELVTVASASGDPMLTLMGVLWRTVDLFLLGDPGAERALAELRQRADALQVRAILFVVAALDVMLLLRAGRIEEGEAAAAKCLELGLEAGDADAVNYYAAHLLNIRWLQGRLDEMLEFVKEFVTSPTLVPGDPTVAAVLAALAAQAGDVEEARRRLTGLRANALPSGSNVLVANLAVVEAARSLADADIAADAYAAMTPFAALPTMGSMAVVCFGPTQRVLGDAALVMGDIDTAVGHYEQAIVQARQIGNRPVLAIAKGSLALARLAHGDRDRDAAIAMANDAANALDAMGLDRRANDLRQAADSIGDQHGAAFGAVRLRDGAYEFRAGGEEALVADGVGVRYLVQLLSAPGQTISAADLAGAPVGGRAQPLSDATALAAYRRRLAELRSEIDEAEADADIERAARSRLELDALVEHLEAQVGLSGKSRQFSDGRERARTAVQKSIRRALDRIAASAPSLGAGLATSIHTGSVCSFEPGVGVPADWRVEDLRTPS